MLTPHAYVNAKVELHMPGMPTAPGWVRAAGREGRESRGLGWL